MIYSVYSKAEGVYYYFSSEENFVVDTPGAYKEIAFLPWQDIKIKFPSKYVPVGGGKMPKGVIVHPDELIRPTCVEETDWIWTVLLLAAQWLLFRVTKENL